MSIFVDENTKVVVQGLTGMEGMFHAQRMLEYGTRVVAGVTPGKGGNKALDVPVFDSVAEAVAKTGANASIIFVPPPAGAEAVMEAAAGGVQLIVCITEGIPVLDMTRAMHFLDDYASVTLIGPNCPGVISPGKCKLGIMPGNIHKKGSIGVVSRSGTLTYEVVSQLTAEGLGQSSCVGIGGDPLIGTSFLDVLARFKDDPDTEAVVLIGEIGGQAEQDAAAYIKQEFRKPVFAFIAGRSAPAGRPMGHAGAVISGKNSSPEEKVAALKAAGITYVESLADIGSTVKNQLRG